MSASANQQQLHKNRIHNELEDLIDTQLFINIEKSLLLNQKFDELSEVSVGSNFSWRSQINIIFKIICKNKNTFRRSLCSVY